MSAKILVVEDNESSRYLAKFILEKAGFSVLQAANGEEAVRVAFSEQPHLILMDLQMPRMDGYEAAKLIRNAPEHRELPILALTSYAITPERARALQDDFAGYLEKPINPETFLTEVSSFLPGKAAEA